MHSRTTITLNVFVAFKMQAIHFHRRVQTSLALYSPSTNSLTASQTSLACAPSSGSLACAPSSGRNGESFPLRLLPSHFFSLGNDIHAQQQMQPHGVAGHPAQRREARPGARRPPPPPQAVLLPPCPRGVVRPRLGPPGLLLRRSRSRPLRHGRLRWHTLLQRRWRRPSRHPRRDHARRPGLLRRQPRRRLQPRYLRHSLQGQGQVQLCRLRQRPERDVPRRAAGPVGEGQQSSSVQERLLRLQLA